MTITTNILGGVAVAALLSITPALAQTPAQPAAPAKQTMPDTSASGTAATQTDTSATGSMNTANKKTHHRRHHAVHVKSASAKENAEENRTTAELNEQQLSNPGSAGVPDASTSNGATDQTQMKAEGAKFDTKGSTANGSTMNGTTDNGAATTQGSSGTMSNTPAMPQSNTNTTNDNTAPPPPSSPQPH